MMNNQGDNAESSPAQQEPLVIQLDIDSAKKDTHQPWVDALKPYIGFDFKLDGRTPYGGGETIRNFAISPRANVPVLSCTNELNEGHMIDAYKTLTILPKEGETIPTWVPPVFDKQEEQATASKTFASLVQETGKLKEACKEFETKPGPNGTIEVSFSFKDSTHARDKRDLITPFEGLAAELAQSPPRNITFPVKSLRFDTAKDPHHFDDGNWAPSINTWNSFKVYIPIS